MFSIGLSNLAIIKREQKNFLAGGGVYPRVEMIRRYYTSGSLEGWIILSTDNPKAIYEHTAQW